MVSASLSTVLAVVLAVLGPSCVRAYPQPPPPSGDRSNSSQPALPQLVNPPTQPALRLYARGTQNYVCAPANPNESPQWTLFGADAPLFEDESERQRVGVHFFEDATPHWRL